MTRIPLYIIFAIFLILQPLSDAKAGIAERNVFLTEMLSLSEKPKQYFIFNIEQNKILLMERGIVLREWNVDHMMFTGTPLPIKILSLESRSVQLAQLRYHINVDDPGDTSNGADANKTGDTSTKKTGDNKTGDNKKPAKFPLDALEIDDMPTDYQLFINGGISINVRSQPEGIDTRIKDAVYLLKWYLYNPILAIKSYFNKTTYTKMDIFFKDQTEAQALFWAFTEGTECIILFPGLGDKDDFKY